MRPLPVVRRFGEKAMARLGLTEADDIPSTNAAEPGTTTLRDRPI